MQSFSKKTFFFANKELINYVEKLFRLLAELAFQILILASV